MKKIAISLLACVAMLAACTPEEVIKVKSIELNQKELSLAEGDTYQLKATVAPDNAQTPELTWTSSKPEIATVENGLITAIAAGETTVTAAATDGSGVEAQCKVTVSAKKIEVTAIELNYSEYALKTGETVTLEATVTPADATNKAVEWATSNASVATVNNGVVTAVAKGTANITAKATDGSNVVSAACVITVSEPKTMFVTYKKMLFFVGQGKPATQKAFYGSIDDYANREDIDNLTFEIDNTSVAEVDANGTVNPVGEGTAVLTTKDTEGNECLCDITVLPALNKDYDYNYGLSLVDCSTMINNIAVAADDTYGNVLTVENVSAYTLFKLPFTAAVDCSSLTASGKYPCLYMRLYISDVTKLTQNDAGGVRISCGANDAEVADCMTWTWNDIKNNGYTLKNGWNNIVLPVALHNADPGKSGSDFNFRSVKFARIWQDPSNVGTGFTAKLGALRFVDGYEFDTCDNFDMWFNKATGNNAYYVKEDGVIAVTDHLMSGATSNYRLVMWAGREYSFPLGMNLSNSALKFKFYVSNAEYFNNNVHAVIELASKGTNDADNLTFAFDYNSVGSEFELNDGWNDITISFDKANIKADTFDPNHINYFRVVFTPNATKCVSYKIDDIKIVKL